LRVLLAEFHGLAPEFGAEGGAQLLIGNQAIEFRDRASESWRFLDLGAEWKRCTGLPFVFAAWALHPSVAPAAAAAFRALKLNGLSQVDAIIAADATSTPGFRRRYLTEHIRFALGSAEKAGLSRYRELLRQHRLIGPDATPLRFI